MNWQDHIAKAELQLEESENAGLGKDVAPALRSLAHLFLALWEKEREEFG